MTVGGTLALDLNIISAFNFENEEVKWTSSNEDIATVDEFGVVTAVSAGKVVITASSEIQQSLSASAVIRITQPPV
ncbi:MAG: Ig-like domain-containing protein [Bacilli bacterium]|nr:Ig-like domain-containing protein [Bacilli bacterium]